MPEVAAVIVTSVDSSYDTRVAPDVRRRMGVHYTPRDVVEFVLQQALTDDLLQLVRETGQPIIDPSCGTGAFIGPLEDKLKRAGGADGLVMGFDVDPQAIAILKEQRRTSNEFGVRDSLIEQIPECAAVIGNPPWGQKKNAYSKEYKALLREKYTLAKGIIDPATLFIELACDKLISGGVLAMVLPDTILLKNYRGVRTLLLENFELLSITHVGKAFAAANIDAIVLVAKKRNPTDKPVKIWHQLPRENTPPNVVRRPSFFERQPEKRFNIFASDEGVTILEVLSKRKKLGDVFHIHEGVHTGNMRKKLICADKGTDRRKIIMRGKEVLPMALHWAGGWLDLQAFNDKEHGDYAQVTPADRAQAPKLVVRRTSDRLICACDPKGEHYFSNNMFILIPKREHVSLERYGNLLNSPIMTGIYRLGNPRVGRLFTEIKINHLRNLPLPSMLKTREKLGFGLTKKQEDYLCELAMATQQSGL